LAANVVALAGSPRNLMAVTIVRTTKKVKT
jgi:hypothetical protein